MTYGLSPRLFLENGPAVTAASVHARSSSDSYRAWSKLDSDHRLILVESALNAPANDTDGFPIAL